MARVNESTRDLLVDSLLGVAQHEYIDRMSKGLDNYQTIVNYDADGEIFLVQDSRFGSLLVPVPIDEAAAFESAFANAAKTPVYAIQDDGLGLREMTYTLPGGQEYRYDNSSDLTFALADIDYEFDAIDINAVADDQLASTGGRQQITSRKVSVGKSDVDLNIPQATATNDKTFAVVIANENYTRLAAVPFARNDGGDLRRILYADARAAGSQRALLPRCHLRHHAGGGARHPQHRLGLPRRHPRAVLLRGARCARRCHQAGLPVARGCLRVDSETCYPSPACMTSWATWGRSRWRCSSMPASAGRRVTARVPCWPGTRRGHPPPHRGGHGQPVVFSAASGDETALPLHREGARPVHLFPAEKSCNSPAATSPPASWAITRHAGAPAVQRGEPQEPNAHCHRRSCLGRHLEGPHAEVKAHLIEAQRAQINHPNPPKGALHIPMCRDAVCRPYGEDM